MSEVEFYRCTPRKLHALYKIHKEVNGLVSKGDAEVTGYIDDVI